MKRLLLLFVIASWACPLFAAPNEDSLNKGSEELTMLFSAIDDSSTIALIDTTSEVQVKFKRGKAIIFTVLTGLLGGHRIYLGTHHRTPIIYSITLGGLGILPLVDLVNIIFTKDLKKFEDKSQIIMWGK